MKSTDYSRTVEVNSKVHRGKQNLLRVYSKTMV